MKLKCKMNVKNISFNFLDFFIIYNLCYYSGSESEVIAELVAAMGPECKESYRRVLGEISRKTPLCGAFQIAGNTDIQVILLHVATGKLDITDSRKSRYLTMIQKEVPLLAKAIVENTHDGTLDDHMSKLLYLLLSEIKKPFVNTEVPGSDVYRPAMQNDFDFFPTLPVTLGPANYEIDRNKRKYKPICRKEGHTHPNLSPGIFTVFCQHEVCLGFSLMRECESPKTPFDILMSRFSDQLDKLRFVYDNSCNLHSYALNREPERFKNTKFNIDRLHFHKNHVSCSLGYDLDQYKSNRKLVELNSQCNEQANSDLRILSKQVTYMNPKNIVHTVSLFLAQRNRKKQNA